jgi:hypothetical protein
MKYFFEFWVDIAIFKPIVKYFTGPYFKTTTNFPLKVIWKVFGIPGYLLSIYETRPLYPKIYDLLPTPIRQKVYPVPLPIPHRLICKPY